jgi:hypothetical protein
MTVDRLRRCSVLNRKTLDILVPMVYALALAIAVIIGDYGGVGGVATIGAVCVGIYYAALRQNIKKAGPDS